jgi:DNA-binding response OmpR family regulator
VTPELLRELGADYLRKPFTTRSLGTAVRRTLGRSRSRREGGGDG